MPQARRRHKPESLPGRRKLGRVLDERRQLIRNSPSAVRWEGAASWPPGPTLVLGRRRSLAWACANMAGAYNLGSEGGAAGAVPVPDAGPALRTSYTAVRGGQGGVRGRKGQKRAAASGCRSSLTGRGRDAMRCDTREMLTRLLASGLASRWVLAPTTNRGGPRC